MNPLARGLLVAVMSFGGCCVSGALVLGYDILRFGWAATFNGPLSRAETDTDVVVRVFFCLTCMVVGGAIGATILRTRR